MKSSLWIFAMAVAALLVRTQFAVAAPEKEATVTLAISGMTWGSCADAVRSALESVKGVKEAKVSLEDKEAVVKYDPDVVKVEDLIQAVNNAQGMSKYQATVKKK